MERLIERLKPKASTSESQMRKNDIKAAKVKTRHKINVIWNSELLQQQHHHAAIPGMASANRKLAHIFLNFISDRFTISNSKI